MSPALPRCLLVAALCAPLAARAQNYPPAPVPLQGPAPALGAVPATGPKAGSAPAPAGGERELTKNLKSSLSFPLRAWIEAPISARHFFAKELSGNIAFNEPLLPVTTRTSGLGAEGDAGSTSRNFSISVKDSPITYWFLQTTFSFYLQPDFQRPWNPDFTYSFGYDDWHPYTFSLTYANYGGNRFDPSYSKGESISRFNQGGLDLGWKFKIPIKVERPFPEPTGARFAWATHYTVAPRYEDLASGKIQDWKQWASLNCTNTVYKFLYWNLTAIKYPYRSRQQPWDPDYTYGFGWFDYRPGKFSAEYNNYAGNRYPWRDQGKTAGKFRSGGVTVFWNLP